MIKWTKNTIGNGVEITIDGFKVDRIRLHYGGFHYYVHWFENPHYAAHHCKMSEPRRSLRSAKRMIDCLKECGYAYSLAELQVIKAELKRIDASHPEYDEAWNLARHKYIAEYESKKKALTRS